MSGAGEDSLGLTMLPSLVFIKLLKLLAVNFNDVRSLSHVNQKLRSLVLSSLHSLYTPFLHLDVASSSDIVGLDKHDINKQILALKLTCSFDGDISPPTHDLFIPICHHLQSLNLRNLKSLEMRNQSSKFQMFKKLMRFLSENHNSSSFNSLEYLKMDVHLINLSEIRNSIIDVLYQHDDFATGGPITNIDYIVNSAVSQVLFTFLQFIDNLFSVDKAEMYDPYGRCYLRELQINFISEPDCDWNSPEMERDNLNKNEVSQLRECLAFMINEFKKRIKLNKKISQKIIVKGIPNFFYNDVLELTEVALQEATTLHPYAASKNSDKYFSLLDEKHAEKFDLVIETNEC